MPKILFASNSISHFPGAIIGSAPWSFSSSRVPYSIQTPLETPVASPLLEVSTTEETWIHFRNGADSWYHLNEEPIIQVVNDFGNDVLSLVYRWGSNVGYRLRSYIDGNNFISNRYYPNPVQRLRTYDIMIRTTALNARIEVYMNEILIEVHDYPITSFRPIKQIVLGGSFGFQGSGNQYFSEIIVADGDTRNARLNLLRPQAVGAYGNWLGPVSSLSDDDPTTGMTTTLPNQSQTTILTPYTGAPNISNVVQVSTSVRGVNSPDQLRHLIRKTGVDYLSDATYDLPFAKEFQITDWTLNPATSLPWTADDLVGMEFGFRSL